MTVMEMTVVGCRQHGSQSGSPYVRPSVRLSVWLGHYLSTISAVHLLCSLTTCFSVAHPYTSRTYRP